MSDEIQTPNDDDTDDNVDDDASVQTAKLYLVVGVVCGVGMLMIIANSFQGNSMAKPSAAPASQMPPNPFNVGIPKIPSPTGDVQRVTGSIADGTEAVSGVVQSSASAVGDGIGWVRGTLGGDKKKSSSNSNSQ